MSTCRSDFFVNLAINPKNKQQVIEKISKSHYNFLNILINTKRLDTIKNIIKEFETTYNNIINTELTILSL